MWEQPMCVMSRWPQVVAECIKQLNSQVFKIIRFPKHISCILKPLMYLTVLQSTKWICSKPLTWITDWIILKELLIILMEICNIYCNIQSLTLIKIQPDATVCRYLFTAKSLYMFRVSQHPSPGILKTVTAASGTGHITGTATSLQRGLIGTAVPIRPHWREVAVPVLWPIPEAVVIVFSIPGDGCCETQNM